MKTTATRQDKAAYQLLSRSGFRKYTHAPVQAILRILFGLVAVLIACGAVGQSYTITPQPAVNGTITPNTAQTVASGLTAVFNESPAAGSVLSAWQVDGNPVILNGTTPLGDGTSVTTSGTAITFNDVLSNHTVAAIFTKVSFTITPQPTANGSISPSSTQTVFEGGTDTFAETPSTGYVLSSWQVDGGTVPGNTTLSDGTTLAISGNSIAFGNLQGSHTVGAAFAVQTFTLTPQSTVNGSITPGTPQTVNYDGSQTFTETPSAGYALTTWQVDGGAVSATTVLADHSIVSVTGSGIQFSSLRGSHTVGAIFAVATFTITPQSPTNGSLTPSSVQTVDAGAHVSFSEAPGTGYLLANWQVDGNNVSANETLSDGTTVAISGITLTFGNVQGSHTVFATFTKVTFTLTPQATTNGSISPNTAQTVGFAGSQSFIETPSGGYVLTSWQVDGNNLSSNGSLKDGTTVTLSGATLAFGNLQGSHTVGAVFGVLTYTLTPQSANNGSIAPNTPQSVTPGGSQVFTETPAGGYVFTTWQVDSANVSANTTLKDGTTVTISGTTLKIGNVQGSHSIGALFGTLTYTLTPLATSNGSITPNTPQSTPPTGSVTFTESPSSGYILRAWQVDGSSVLANATLSDGTTIAIQGNTIAFANVLGNHTVSASFTQNVAHPADTNGDFRIGINELTAYGSAWRHGAAWPTGPNPIPQDYVTVAAGIWLAGEAYQYNPALPPPACWFATSNPPRRAQAPVLQKAAAVASIFRTPNTANSWTVTITVSAPPNTAAYSIEELVPTGAVVSGVTGGGIANQAAGSVRWGPFLDSKTRTLTYLVTGATLANGRFSGTASFDGLSLTISGDRQVPGGSH